VNKLVHLDPVARANAARRSSGVDLRGGDLRRMDLRGEKMSVGWTLLRHTRNLLLHSTISHQTLHILLTSCVQILHFIILTSDYGLEIPAPSAGVSLRREAARTSP
jgi:hypothetical protein